jgi:hypothetical protein
MLFRWLLLAPLFAMFFFGLILPSDGNHGITSPKSLSYLAAAAGWVAFILLQRRYDRVQTGILTLCMGIVALLLGWMFLGILYGDTPFSSVFDQFKLFLITLTVVGIVLYYVEGGVIKPQWLFKCAIYTNFIYSSAKVLGATLHIAGLVNILTFMQKTGIRFMSMDIHAGVIRLQTSVDIITPYLLLFVLNSERLGLKFPKGFRYAYIAVSLLSVLLSFSRYLIVVSWIALFLYWMTIRPIKQLMGALVVIFVLVMGVSALGPENVYKVIEKRLFSIDNYYSDQTRVDQVNAMTNEIACYPLLGKGLGGYATECVRDDHLLHSYEVQWVAFTMQLGFVGVTLIIFAFFVLGWRYFLPPYLLPKMTFAAMFLLWLVSGFTNPFLISLTSGIVYSLFAMAAIVLSQREPKVSSCPSPS